MYCDEGKRERVDMREKSEKNNSVNGFPFGSWGLISDRSTHTQAKCNCAYGRAVLHDGLCDKVLVAGKRKVVLHHLIGDGA